MGRIPMISRRFPPLLLALAVAACGSPRHATESASSGTGSHVSGITCAPFARELSGIALYGDAATWWDNAAGQYSRGNKPVIGSVLVLRREARLPSGHVAVVSQLLTPRQLLVIQANWVPEQLQRDQLVVDVSDHNDWSQIRVWYPPTNQLGTHTYPAYGFILPPKPATHDELVKAEQPAALYSINTRGRQPPRARTYGS